MPYKFTFDISKTPHRFFTEIALASYNRGVHKVFLNTLHDIISKFRIQEATGLNLDDSLLLIQDLIDIQALNLMQRGKFLQTKKRALLLPHCSRKYMDGRCKAVFDANIPTYVCAHCSPDCDVNKATRIAKEKGYDVYILPGGSCVPKILKTHNYEGVVGVACGEEVKMSMDMLSSMDVTGQSVPLLKNGCSNTVFNLNTLIKTL
ncbi:MAG: DUF116 domain-containing protein [Candidatus Bathyarchaeota archaeon]|nr:DUF116 domain-containing protein [Candidatus Bathyarchaeota archaeon]